MKSFSATSWLAIKRSHKLLGMSATIAHKVTINKARSLFKDKSEQLADQDKLLQDIGEKIAATLGSMKGAVMKVGQVASQMQGLFPEQISLALEKLQKDAPPMSYDVIAAQIEAQLGAAPEMIFACFDPEPFSSASIGQVHRAITKTGEQVAVKVQYPGVKQACDSDLRQLKRLLSLAGLIKVDRETVAQLFDEIRTQLYQELDYESEAKNLQLLQRFHKSDRYITIPKYYESLSSKEVLTLSYEPGDALQDLHDLGYDKEIIKQIGQHLFDMIARQIFQLQAVHADPHPGNFAFRPNGTVILYDFGAIKKLPTEIVQQYQALVWACLKKDYATIEQVLLQLKVRKPTQEVLGAAYYQPWVELFMAPFKVDEPFDFAANRLHNQVITKVKQETIRKTFERFQPSANTMITERVISGHYWNLVQLKLCHSFYNNLVALIKP